MKNYSYIGISFVILIFGIIVVPEIIDRINEREVVSSNRSDGQEERASENIELEYIMVNQEKKKVPAFEFIDQHGDTITNKDYEGKVYIAEFFFSTCPTICPIMKENLVQVQDVFAKNDDFGIASFSIDPQHDTPGVLKEYAALNNITHPNWHLLTGKREEIYDLANSGFNIYAGEDENAEGGFAHSGYFALVDKEGYIRSRKDRHGNPIIYYRGSVPRKSIVEPGEEEPQIDILIADAKKLVNDK
ncbi:SCO family protein [Salinimicrobium sediminilitoris]|uniref:SCO family protein n=1 Tax=Salinimicrobium sediminilitoris TaxID=2876715 RepID=UPI001E5DDF48|nr:SCO family protein [Salinimicrobium sediminilitoris]MCC8359913.1 SCO family protein [Salinimicrobium sediminilitoris]